MAYTALHTLIKLIYMVHLNCKDTSTNDTDYNCHIKPVELVYSITWA